MEFDSWVVGFAEAEGSFTSNRIYPVFEIAQNEKEILDKIKTFFRVGSVLYKKKKNSWAYRVAGRNCWPIRTFFEGKLITNKKKIQFEQWKHLKWIGNFTTKVLEQVNFEDWLIGFIEGEASFTKTSDGRPEFSISQNEKKILERIKSFFGIGKITLTGNKRAWQYRIYDIDSCKLIEKFCENKLLLKNQQTRFEDWKNLKWREPFYLTRIDKEHDLIKQVYKNRFTGEEKVVIL